MIKLFLSCLMVGSFLLFQPHYNASAAAESQKTAEADIVNTKGEKIGTASFAESKQGVKVSIQAAQLPPGNHGIHFHETGLCTTPKFKTAGEHFNPDGKEHGLKNKDGAHDGDLPNLKVAKDGTVNTEFTTSMVTLGPGKSSLLKKGTTAIVIHAKGDDQVSQPAGDSGDRIACGVINEKTLG